MMTIYYIIGWIRWHVFGTDRVLWLRNKEMAHDQRMERLKSKWWPDTNEYKELIRAIIVGIAFIMLIMICIFFIMTLKH